MSETCESKWDKFCEENLLQHGLLSGVCLISSQGRLIYSYGELESVAKADLPQFVAAFRYVSSKSEAEVYNKGFTVVYNRKKKLFKIFQKTLSSIYASGENEEECMIVCRLSYGVLICVHQQPKANAKVIDVVEQFCDQLRM